MIKPVQKSFSQAQGEGSELRGTSDDRAVPAGCGLSVGE